MDERTEDFLAHYGVKGMQWGRRKQKQLALNQRVASGKGSKLDKVKVGLNTSAYQRLKAGSLAGVAAKKAGSLEAQKARVDAGKTTVRDKIDLMANTSMLDLLRPTGSPG